VYPVNWEYARWRKLGFASATVLVIGSVLPEASPLWGLAANVGLLVVIFPAMLLALRFLTAEELIALRKLKARYL